MGFQAVTCAKHVADLVMALNHATLRPSAPATDKRGVGGGVGPGQQLTPHLKRCTCGQGVPCASKPEFFVSMFIIKAY